MNYLEWLTLKSAEAIAAEGKSPNPRRVFRRVNLTEPTRHQAVREATRSLQARGEWPGPREGARP
ncbi:hypothetical protein P12x_003018 [Tundrisphaera lichenicola]|uniref:hypothetical protein n=1 Tax=Tundrisphaera lichenicola TaxID=2029860 RepID=UPI003EBF27AB